MQNWIADSAAEMQAARLMTLHAAWVMDTRGASAARFYDGPDEVHRESVARQILRGYEPAAGGVATEHVPTRRDAARRRFAEVLEAVTADD